MSTCPGPLCPTLQQLKVAGSPREAQALETRHPLACASLRFTFSRGLKEVQIVLLHPPPNTENFQKRNYPVSKPAEIVLRTWVLECLLVG